jgi:hypothetical protein
MSVHKYNSWGRTRRPKAAISDGSGSICTTLPALTALDIANTGSSISTDNGIYKTENQRYMHIHCSGSGNNVSNVYCYLYASQQWSELMEISGSTQRASIAVADNQYTIVDIKGADLVAVAGSGSPYLAFSTF